MKTVLKWLGRIPWWAWLILAFTQIVNLIVIPARLAKMNAVLLAMDRVDNKPLRDAIFWETFGLGESAVLVLVFLIAAYWKWSLGRGEQRAVHGLPPVE